MRAYSYKIISLAALVAALIPAACSFDMADAGKENGAGQLSITIDSRAVAAPGDTVKVSAHVSDTYYQVRDYSWLVSDPMAGVVTSSATDSTGSRIRFTVQQLGTHSITCWATMEATGAVLQAKASLLVEDPKVKQLSYTVRIIPAPSSGYPPTDKKVSVGRADQTALGWTLDSGSLVQLSVSDGKAALPSYVRFFRTSKDLMPRDIYLASGTGAVRLGGFFHALFMPDSDTVAPYLETYVDAASLDPSWKVMVPRGALVEGKVTTTGDQALAGARLALHVEEKSIKVPSTPGLTDAGGAFSLRARTGLATLTVVPPSSAGLPVAVVADPKFQIHGDASGWTFGYQQAAMVKASGKVLRSDGKTPAAGATVQLELSGTVKVGTLKTASGSFDARALVRRVLVADSSGTLKDQQSGTSDLELPPGTYQLQAWPGSATPGNEGHTRQTLVVVAGSPASLDVKLTPRAKVSGKVLDQQGLAVAAASITARGSTGSFNATADSGGAFSLVLDDKNTYNLVIRSIGGSKVGSLINPAFKVSGGASHSFTLPPAVLLSGRVTTTGNLALASALIRVWCSGSNCSTAEVADETHTGVDGSFEVRVPASDGKN